MNTKKIVRIDASSLTSSGNCILKLWLTTHEGYKSRALDISMEYGSAFHIYKEQLKLKGNHELATVVAIKYLESKLPFIVVGKNKSFLTSAHLLDTCNGYVDKFGVNGEKDSLSTVLSPVTGKPLIESTFNLPYYEDDNLVVMLTGTIDDITIDRRTGLYSIGDEKTTSMYDIGAYFEPYALSPQLMFYLNAVQWHAERYPDSIFGTMVKAGRVGCYINGVFLSASKPTIYQRSPIYYYSKEQMGEFKDGVRNIIAPLIDWLTLPTSNVGHRPFKQGLSNGACLGNYGKKCPFFKACTMPDDESMFGMLDNFFDKKDYNPLEFRKQ